MREKWQMEGNDSTAAIEEGRIVSFNKCNDKTTSYRVHKDGEVGIHFQVGEMTDEEGFAKAEKNLERKRPYPFEPETGKRSRDKTEQQLTDRELLDVASECLEGIVRNYPRFIFSGSFSQSKIKMHLESEAGIDYTNIDCAVSANISFKHVESKDIMDGNFGFSLRTFDKEVFVRMAEDYLGNFERPVALPEEVIIDMQYYGLLGMLSNSLDAENLALGTSLLTGKVGQKVFSEEFTLEDDVSDEECWFNYFWDGDGCVREDGKLLLIENSVIVTGYADKRNAKKYGAPHTKSAGFDFADLPYASCLNLRIKKSKKTIKELLAGRPCVIPISMGGGGFNDKGDYTMPVQGSLLYDGEKVVGKLPPFTMVSSMYDMFGKDFIGVGADHPIYNDKQILFRVRTQDIL